MKTIKKLPIFLLAIMLCVGMMVIPAYAESSTQDGLEVNLTTNKETYSQDEQIVATLTVTNTNEVAVSNVSLENVIPEGYKLANGSEATKQVESLESGESVTLAVTYVTDPVNDNESDPSSGNNAGSGENSGAGTGNNSGNNGSGSNTGNTNTVIATGDNSNIIFWGLLLVMASAGIITILILKKKKSKKLLSLFLCVTMVGSLATGISTKAYAEENNTSHINIEHIIVVDGEELTIRGIVNYNNIQSTDPSDDSVINLSASKTEYSLSEDGTIYFYAEVNCEAENVSLIDAETEEVLLELVDDGKYSESGDDLPGDLQERRSQGLPGSRRHQQGRLRGAQQVQDLRGTHIGQLHQGVLRQRGAGEEHHGDERRGEGKVSQQLRLVRVRNQGRAIKAFPDSGLFTHFREHFAGHIVSEFGWTHGNNGAAKTRRDGMPSCVRRRSVRKKTVPF